MTAAAVGKVPFIEVEIPHDLVANGQLDLCADKLSPFAHIIASLLSKIRPNWMQNNKCLVDIEIYTNGITNIIFCLTHIGSGEKMVVRLYGAKTEQLIDRTSEIVNFERLYQAGLGPAVCARFSNGFVCSFLPGKCLSMESVREPHIVEKICQTMARMHKIPLGTAGTARGECVEEMPMFNAKCQQWLDNLPTQFERSDVQKQFDKYFNACTLSDQLDQLTKALKMIESPLVFAHNDLLPFNILFDEDGTGDVHFIDYEYAGKNYQLFDIANHFCEYAGVDDSPNFALNSANENERRHFLHRYFAHFGQLINEEGHDMDKMLWKVRHFEAAAHFFWTLWAIHQAAISTIQFDYMRYAITRHRYCIGIMHSLGIIIHD